LKGRKVLIGDGPYLKELKRKYPDVEFLGKIEGEELAGWIASANVFVFPSKTDTFGIVILESIACGTPVAAYEQPGPRAVIANNYNGYISNNLEKSVEMCYGINRDYVSDSSRSWTWDTATTQFIEALHE
jgi:glycosyltransferase involved in cell wall biosynthesis